MAYIKAEADKKSNATVELDGSELEVLALLTEIVDSMKDEGIPEKLIVLAIALGIEGKGVKREENA